MVSGDSPRAKSINNPVCARLPAEMRENASRLFVWGTYVVAAAVVVQFLLAGLGVFADSGFLFWHASVNSVVVGLLPLVLVLVGWLGRVPGRVRCLMASMCGRLVLLIVHIFAHLLVG